MLIIGQEGMGKTMLANRMAEEAETSGAPLQCRVIRYEVTSDESATDVMELMLRDAHLVLQKKLDPLPILRRVPDEEVAHL